MKRDVGFLGQACVWVLVLGAPVLMGARGGGCESVGLQTPAPDMTGEWDVQYDDRYEVEIELGGAVHTAELGLQGGTVEVTHEGQPFRFELDCMRPDVVCPSEVWPETITASHRHDNYPHRVWMTLPLQECDGTLREPGPEECGQGTDNPDCDKVCDGELRVRDQDTFGVIDEDGDGFELWLGANAASNGLNCALLGNSVADADLVSTGSAEQDDWQATELTDGRVTTVYSGGCLFAGDPDMDEETEAVVVGARVEVRTGFTAVKR